MVDDPVNPRNVLKGLVHSVHEAKLSHVELLIYCRGNEVMQTFNTHPEAHYHVAFIAELCFLFLCNRRKCYDILALMLSMWIEHDSTMSPTRACNALTPQANGKPLLKQNSSHSHSFPVRNDSASCLVYKWQQ